MKKIGRLKLSQLVKNELESKQMNLLKGGDCSCACDCSCSVNCSCTPYPPEGASNSMTTSNSMSYISTSQNVNMMSGSNAYVPAMGGYGY
jgi:natural product precursor